MPLVAPLFQLYVTTDVPLPFNVTGSPSQIVVLLDVAVTVGNVTVEVTITGGLSVIHPVVLSVTVQI